MRLRPFQPPLGSNPDHRRRCLAAERAFSAPSKPRFGHRTKTEQPATILLRNPVAAHVTKRDVTDGRAKILKENSTVRNGPATRRGTGRARLSPANRKT